MEEYISSRLEGVRIGEYEREWLERAVHFHGHLCAALILGVRMGLLALRKLQMDRSRGEELVAIVETDSCAADGIQVTTGCTFGKGNFMFRDYGKMAATFYDRKHGRAIRISAAHRWNELMSELSEDMNRLIQQKGREGEAPFEELFAEIRRSLSGSDKEKRMEKLLIEMSDDDLFTVRDVRIEEPKLARIFFSVVCERCGESVMEPRARIRSGKRVCIPCSGEDKYYDL